MLFSIFSIHLKKNLLMYFVWIKLHILSIVTHNIFILLIFSIQDNMYYEIAYVLREVMLCCRKCHMVGHALVECMSSGWHILQYVVFY